MNRVIHHVRMGIIFSVLFGCCLWAGEVTWDGGHPSNNDWMEALNWSDDQVPSAANTYVIDSTTGGTAENTSGATFNGYSLEIKSGGVLRVGLSAGNTVVGAGGMILSGGEIQHYWAGDNRELRADGGFTVRAGTETTIFVEDITFGSANRLRISGALSGSGTIVKTGIRELSFSTTSPNFTGTLRMNAGLIEENCAFQRLPNATIELNGGRMRIWSATFNGNLIWNGGTLYRTHGGGYDSTFNGIVNITADSTFENPGYNGSGDTFAGTLTGNGNLIIGGTYGSYAYVNFGSGLNSSGYVGAIDFARSGAVLQLSANAACLGGLKSLSGYGEVRRA
ncbi:MAG: hypothetical protein N2255_10335, partial [Kiritimatiellae bacterium]|nr:hypothetical protein [Kiritimatiellia bacterium]